MPDTVANPFNVPDWRSAIRLVQTIPWKMAAGMRGNPHSSLIGLILTWWIANSERNWVLDGPPSAGQRRVADLVLGRNSAPNAVVEVEGTNYLDKIDTLGMYLRTDDSHFSGISMAILVCYAYPPERPRLPVEEICEALVTASTANREYWWTAIFLEKSAAAPLSPIMSRNGYYRFVFSKASVLVARGGSAMNELQELWESRL